VDITGFALVTEAALEIGKASAKPIVRYGSADAALLDLDEKSPSSSQV